MNNDNYDSHNYEIERKFLVNELPKNLGSYPHKNFEQAYISTSPTIRIRQEGDDYFLTVKGAGNIKKIEYNLEINKDQYENLLPKISGNYVTKIRYFIPLENNLTAELDVYLKNLKGLYTVEVEFDDLDTCNNFIPPSWFGKDVSKEKKYKNTSLSKLEGYSDDY